MPPASSALGATEPRRGLAGRLPWLRPSHRRHAAARIRERDGRGALSPNPSTAAEPPAAPITRAGRAWVGGCVAAWVGGCVGGCVGGWVPLASPPPLLLARSVSQQEEN